MEISTPFSSGASGSRMANWLGSSAGGMKWPYCNSILKSWHEKGLHTVEEIQAAVEPVLLVSPDLKEMEED